MYIKTQINIKKLQKKCKKIREFAKKISCKLPLFKASITE